MSDERDRARKISIAGCEAEGHLYECSTDSTFLFCTRCADIVMVREVSSDKAPFRGWPRRFDVGSFP